MTLFASLTVVFHEIHLVGLIGSIVSADAASPAELAKPTTEAEPAFVTGSSPNLFAQLNINAMPVSEEKRDSSGRSFALADSVEVLPTCSFI